MSEAAFVPGDRCDRYEIVRLIAAGGIGEVYEAVHAFTGRPVALKCLQLEHAGKPDLLERMRLEAVVLCELQHPNIVTVYDAGVTDGGTIWIAMELLVGQTLRDLLHAAGRLPLERAAGYACEIAAGIEAAHDLHVVHRDLKPENVFVVASGEVKVLDLGAAKFHGYGLKTTDRLRTLGTPAYMSPEHLRGEKIDARADVYALGLMLYEMLAGRHALLPRDGEGAPDAVEAGALQLFAEPRPLREVAPDIPAGVAAIVEKAIAKDREMRWASMPALSAALRDALGRLRATPARPGRARPGGISGERLASATTRSTRAETTDPARAAPTLRPEASDAPAVRTRAALLASIMPRLGLGTAVAMGSTIGVLTTAVVVVVGHERTALGTHEAQAAPVREPGASSPPAAGSSGPAATPRGEPAAGEAHGSGPSRTAPALSSPVPTTGSVARAKGSATEPAAASSSSRAVAPAGASRAPPSRPPDARPPPREELPPSGL